MTSLPTQFVFVAAIAACASASDAALVSTNSWALWSARVAQAGLQVAGQDFSSYSGQYAGISGSTGGIAWDTSAVDVSAGVVRSSTGSSVTFTFSPGVSFVGGNFFGVNGSFSVQSVAFAVSLNGGGGFTGISVGPSGFTGFTATGGSTISSLTITVGASGAYPAIDNMYFGVVPAPGALALVGAAALIATNSRRR